MGERSPNGFRKCKRCGEIKPKKEFSATTPICNSCKLPVQEKIYADKKERKKAQKKRYYEKYPEKLRERNIKARKRKNPNYMSHEERRANRPPKKTMEEIRASYRRKCKRCNEYLPLDKFEGKRRICSKCAKKPISGYDVTEYSEKKRCQAHRYEARKKGLVADYTYLQWVKTKKVFNNKCAYCGVEHTLSQDHFIPLCEGGGYTRNNIIPVCHMCNSSKRNLDFFEWYPQQEFYSKDREEKILNYLNYHDHFQQLMLG